MRILPHHCGVGQHVGTPDLNHLARTLRRLQGLNQIFEYIANGNGLHSAEHPLRTDHAGQPLSQVPDDLKRSASRAHNDRSPELGHRHTGLMQGPAGLLARAQMR